MIMGVSPLSGGTALVIELLRLGVSGSLRMAQTIGSPCPSSLAISFLSTIRSAYPLFLSKDMAKDGQESS